MTAKQGSRRPIHTAVAARTLPNAQLAQNVSFLVDDVYHPGDSLTPPGAYVGTLLLPTDAPWLRVFDAAQFLRTVRPDRAFSIQRRTAQRTRITHNRRLAREADTLGRDVRRLAVGETVSLP